MVQYIKTKHINSAHNFTDLSRFLLGVGLVPLSKYGHGLMIMVWTLTSSTIYLGETNRLLPISGLEHVLPTEH